MLRRTILVTSLLALVLVAAVSASGSPASAVHATSPSAATADPPNVTGAWTPNNGAPAWQLTASGPGLNHLHADWHGPAGHETLFGQFDGSLNSAGTSYSGSFVVNEQGQQDPVAGTMTFQVDSIVHITVFYAQQN
nr:hypothetical protein [Actinomycetota bacterium]